MFSFRFVQQGFPDGLQGGSGTQALVGLGRLAQLSQG